MPKGRGSSFAVVALGVSVLMVACLPQKPQEGDIIGLWVERRGMYCDDKDLPCASLEFHPDGSFEAKNLPMEHFTFTHYKQRRDVSGTWQLGEPGTDYYDTKIGLKFGGYNVRLSVLNVVDGFILSAWASDENERVFFDRAR
jgi:hypothetical protein